MTHRDVWILWSIASLLIAACSNTASPRMTHQTLPAKTVSALQRALEDERHAEDTYAAVMAKHGEVRPFVNIIEAERRHQQELLALFEKYAVPVPKREQPSVATPDSLEDACRQGLDAEKLNIGMYDELLEGVDEKDIRDTFLRLQSASRDRHLPAFERCVRRRRGR